MANDYEVLVEVRRYTVRIGICGFTACDWISETGDTLTTVIIAGRHVDINTL